MTKLLATILGLALISSGTSVQPNPETIFHAMETQVGAEWGLDRVDGVTDSTYSYGSSGDGVRIYIVDTGVDANHPDLSGRVLDGFDAFNQNLDQSDCQGHGTHVAGIVAGTKYGVAKKSLIVPVRVLNCSGQGNTSTLTAGIDWILKNHSADYAGIINMSLGGPKDDAVNAAVSQLVDAGMVVITAAGNSNVDACTFSPASARGVVAVGSINYEGFKSPFSNWGDCVDIFAPGSKISSNVPGNYSAISQKSGTSQAAGFVSGAVATYVSGDLARWSDGLLESLSALSQRGVVLDSNSLNNNLVNVAPTNYAPDVPITDTVPIVSAPTVKNLSAPKNFTIKYNKLYWSRPAYSGSFSKVSYVIEQYVNNSWSVIGETKSLSYSLDPTKTSNTSLYRVSAKTSQGLGPATLAIRNVGASAANLIAPMPDPVVTIDSKVSVAQRGGLGSVTADVSWAKVDGATRYKIEVSIYNTDTWSLVRSTTGTSVKVTTKLGILYNIRVKAVLSDGMETLTGVAQYLAK
jgi:subtilisin family serine protease